ncbi:MAG: sigma-70 family RNA polymerase sigma factor [Planctomycetes bacterium]|nr:sigma-70 family RNA polymerase sigma factor [Planctomycetota bacterium]
MAEDRTPRIEELLAQTQWVRELARRLVTDPHLADDLAQDTMVAALEHRENPPRSPRAWLGSVLLNLVRDAYRREQRRRRRESAAAGRDPEPSTLEVVERAATHARVVEAVLALKEPYRGAILLRFFDDLPPRKIARRLDVPVATVNTRLQRGLDHLRADLDRAFPGGRREWRQALLVLAWPERGVVAAAGAALVTSAGAVLAVATLLLAVVFVFRAIEGGKKPLERRTAAAPAMHEPQEAALPSDAPAPVETVVPVVPPAESAAPEERPRETPGERAPENQAVRPRAAPAGTWSGETAPIADMVYIPGGTARIGMSEQEIQALGVENVSYLKTLAASTPVHEVQLQPYYIDRCEVTNHQWRVYLEVTGQQPGPDLQRYGWPGGRIPEGQENMPVAFVSLREAEAFARWAGKRLPTEEEWEFAARGPEGLLYPWGNDLAGEKVWCAASQPPICQAQAVGAKPAGASSFGVLDMAGNVWEWTSSRYEEYPGYEDIRVSTKHWGGMPGEFSAAEFFSSTRRVIRGGAFNSEGTALLGAVRQYAEQSTWFNTLGFRCARCARPGLDAARAIDTANADHWALSEASIDPDSVLAFEQTWRDEPGAITAFRRVSFASLLGPVGLYAARPVLGVLSTSEDLLEPRAQAGDYVVLGAWDDPASVVLERSSGAWLEQDRIELSVRCVHVAEASAAELTRQRVTEGERLTFAFCAKTEGGRILRLELPLLVEAR